jgi:hypothetical protein
MTVHIFETFRLPISDAEADFTIAAVDGGTKLTLRYSYRLNRIGRLIKSFTAGQLRQGIGGLAASLQRESERLAAV